MNIFNIVKSSTLDPNGVSALILKIFIIYDYIIITALTLTISNKSLTLQKAKHLNSAHFHCHLLEVVVSYLKKYIYIFLQSCSSEVALMHCIS